MPLVWSVCLRRLWLFDGEQFAWVIVPTAFLLDEDLASDLA